MPPLAVQCGKEAVVLAVAGVIESATGKPIPDAADAAVTPVTAENDDTADKATSEPLPAPSMEAEAEQFEFSPPGDPANDDEALAERAGIMAVENGWSDAQALQEARWQADRERCWRAISNNGFLRIRGKSSTRRSKRWWFAGTS